MEFDNSFSVRAPLSTVWNFMLDAREVAPCVPGAQITEQVDDTNFKGTVKIKLGAVQMTYRGELRMEPREESRTIVLHAKGTETRGSGGASGTLTTVLSEDNGTTRVDIHSQVDVTGRVAQFGRGIMQDVANRLIKEFARCLETKLTPQSSEPMESATISDNQTADTRVPSVVASPSSSPEESFGSPEQSAPAASVAISSHAPQAQASSHADHVPSAEIKVQKIVFDLVRVRAAQALRALASLVEPK